MVLQPWARPKQLHRRPAIHAPSPSRSAAAHLGLPPGLPVAQGGADAFIGCIGLGVIAPGSMAMLTGSSHLHIGMAAAPLSGRGMFGSYQDALLPGGSVRRAEACRAATCLVASIPAPLS